MSTDRSISPTLPRACDLLLKISGKLEFLEEVQRCLEASIEKSDDLEQVRRLMHELGGLIHEMGLVTYLLNMESAASETSATDAVK